MLNDVPHYYPALMRAEKVQKKAKGAGFDWDNIDDVYAKVYEEIDELKQAQAEGNKAHIEEEYGDLLFAAVNLGRFLGVTPETALADASNKFVKRFEKMEQEAVKENKDLAQMSLFDTVQDNDIVDEIRDLDMTNLTPMEAMNILYNLQNKIKNRW